MIGDFERHPLCEPQEYFAFRLLTKDLRFRFGEKLASIEGIAEMLAKYINEPELRQKPQPCADWIEYLPFGNKTFEIDRDAPLALIPPRANHLVPSYQNQPTGIEVIDKNLSNFFYAFAYQKAKDAGQEKNFIKSVRIDAAFKPHRPTDTVLNLAVSVFYPYNPVEKPAAIQTY